MANVKEEILKKVKGWAGYVDAKLGFRNHWYPVAFGKDIDEGQPQKIKLLGEDLLVSRVNGKLFCIKDRCLHRGVSFSVKIESYTPETITCWYHGWTYRWEDGLLSDIITNPESIQIGKQRVKVYPVQEAKGCVFIFLGDIDPPPLVTDVPPTFLDDDMVICGQNKIVHSNWRLAAENGFDPAHIFIHKDSVLIKGNDLALPLGFAPKGDAKMRTRIVEDDEEQGAKGVFDLLAEASVPVFEGKIDGKVVRTGNFGHNRVANNISIWLPGVLRVQPFPDPATTQFEWYVPVDENSHYYFQTIGKRCASPAEEQVYMEEFNTKWRAMALDGFNNDDVWAREAMVGFYADDEGWLKEILFEADSAIVDWRKLCSKHNRGVQTQEHIKA
ncbi:carbazole dioxygenase [Rugosibacter aromaticivorans]|uniref:Carbazole dioxygenase n=1 Tax=Rugosibacter aromaticivorans TaxID=1565605 RepID=A0A0C5JAR2_9PROT|nr:Rieske 2Fe-2S domain-containing protein [Rugosibacter aromaticivorans]AJP48893.1 carbazole dioxygenase [Rugosibacter aromaticivorans]TBR13600.1 MAG: carbazole dioxygenase [Rugosibacter sp.]